jgi:SOS-response transcriptional repressor LexA
MDPRVISFTPHIKPDHNDYIVLKNEEDEAVFKQLKKYGKARLLHPLNPNHPDIELNENIQYKVIGKVVEKKKRY